MATLVTGAAGFIGAYTCRALAARGETVVGLDNFNSYYDPALKRDRVAALCAGLDLRTLDLGDRDGLAALFDEVRPERVVHLAAQAGVRYSLQNPHAYVDSNLAGFVNVLELCRHRGVQHLVYASSSSVYGDSATPPFSEDQRVDQPRSLYAATKAANELMAHTYAHLYGLRATGLRFFTVYGPWGRPDMAPLLFSRAVLAGRPIDVFNHGRMRRDFTFVDDIVAGVLGALDHPPAGEPPHRVFNLGNHTPVELEHFIAVIEQAAGRPAQKVYKPMQPGDMIETMADTSRARAAFGFEPATPIESGLPQVVHWCRDYFGVGGMSTPRLSVVVPVFNERDNVAPLVREITAALRGREAFEIVYVDDDSRDDTLAVLRALKAEVPELRVVHHATQSGQSTAVRTGVKAARGAWIATLDGDGQNDPADIPKLLAQRATAAPEVKLFAGWRVDRRDSGSKRWASKWANAIRSRMLRDDTPDTGCGIKLFEREAFLDLPFFNHMHRYLPALMQRAGWKTVSVPVNHRARSAGVSKYNNLNRALVGIADLRGVAWLIRRGKVTRVEEV